ncbi:MAG: transposase [Limisphaerales bacterium]|nr:MAG: transposase [Limisphaerales bacterium]
MSESEPGLFEASEIASTPEKPAEPGVARTREPQRAQTEIRFSVPDDLVTASNPARLFWELLGRLDLTGFGLECGSVEGKAGRSMLSPRMLLTLWLYAISEGVGSAREIERLTKRDTVYRWIVGDLEVSHHKLSRFRVGHGEALNGLMTDVLASLMEKGLLSLDLLADDGTRTRAAASAPSFRTYGSLLECRAQAALHLKAVLAAADDPEYTRAQHTRRAAAARDLQQRVEAAIATVTEIQEQRTPAQNQKLKPARASTTDAEARVMKMGDGGFRPAYNVQYAVAGSELGGPRTIVAAQVTNVGSDMGDLTPMVKQVEERTGQLPKVLLADGGHAKAEDITTLKGMGVDVLVPPPENAKSIDKLKAEGAGAEVINWRERMNTPAAAKAYRARAGLCELANAHQKSHHGLTQFLVRGLDKVTCVTLLSAIAFNLSQHASHLLR